MSRGLLFWIIFILAVIGWFVNAWPLSTFGFGASVVIVILVALLGWQVFGPPIHG